MNKRVVALLAVVVAALGAYLFFVERGALSSKELDERKGRALGSFVRTRVDQLTLKHGGLTLELTRKPGGEGELGGFRILSPIQDDADEAAVDSLLGELEWLSARRVIDNPSAEDLKGFGLDKPGFELGYRVSGATHALRVGKADVHGDSYYARLDGEKRVMVVPKTLVEALDHTPGHFRGKQFLGDITSVWARKLDIRSGDKTLSIEKENGRFWLADAPRGFADDERVREVIKAIDSVTATRYLEGEMLARASGPALVAATTMTLKTVPDDAREDQKAEAFTLTIYGPCPEHADERVARASDKGDLVCVLTSAIQPLLDLGDLREHHLLTVDPSDVERITLTGGGSEYVIKRKDAGWEAEKAPDPVDAEAVSAWLADLRAVEGAYADPKAHGASPWSLALSLSGDRRASMAIEGAPGGEIRIVREGEGLLLRFAGDASALLSAERGRFPKLDVWHDKKPSDVKSVTARVDTTKRTLTLVDGSFRTGAKAEPVADSLRVRELVRLLLKTKALSYIGAALPHHGFAAPKANLELGAAEGALKLELGSAAGEGAFYARIDGGRVFRVEASVLAQLYELAGSPVPEGLVPAMGTDEDDGEDDEHDHAHE